MTDWGDAEACARRVCLDTSGFTAGGGGGPHRCDLFEAPKVENYILILISVKTVESAG